MKVLRALSGGLTSIILVAALAALAAWILRVSIVKRAEAEQTAQRMAIAAVPVRKGAFEVFVEVRGKLAAVNSRQVVAEVTGQIVYLAPNGTDIKEGDIVAELDVPRMLRRVRDQEQQYKNALDDFEKKKRDLAAEVDKARIALEKAKSELEQYRTQQAIELADKRSQKQQDADDLKLTRTRSDRQRGLAEEGLVPLREVELADAKIKAKEFALERQTKDLELSEAQKEAKDLDREAAVTKAESELARAESKQEAELQNASTALAIRKTQLDRVQDEFGKSIIRAPADGILVLEEQWQGRGMQRRPVQPGDRVWEGRSIASIPDLSEMRVEIELSQEQARLAKAKQKAAIAVDALPGLALDGEVTEVSQTAGESTLPGTGMPSGERTFQARVSIEDLKGARLRPGMTAHVRIIVETLSDAISLPLECVFDQEDTHIVYVQRGQEFRPIEVELGPKNEAEVVITEGLKGGEKAALRDVGESGPPLPPPADETSSVPLLPQGNSQ